MLSRKVTANLFHIQSEKGSALKGKNLGANSFPFKVEPFTEGIWCAGKQTGSPKSYLPCKNGRNSTNCIRSPFKHLTILGLK